MDQQRYFDLFGGISKTADPFSKNAVFVLLISL